MPEDVWLRDEQVQLPEDVWLRDEQVQLPVDVWLRDEQIQCLRTYGWEKNFAQIGSAIFLSDSCVFGYIY